MTIELAIILLLFAAVGFAGAGAALAVASRRLHRVGERDVGMLGVGVLLFGFAMLCAGVLSGLAGICALGGPVTWASYLFTAQRLGMFEVGAGPLGEVPAEEPRHTT
ncbi:MAG TPA: hypothetical protein VK939_13125 [Longimicrobiales bacterium]|nr:hypothetical protein [Longimicrobiales bacterium]